MKKFTFNIDHVVVVVSNLDTTIKQFQALGFNVSAGGVNGPTHNALIPFQDGTYIELISTRSWGVKGILRFLSCTKLIYLLKPIVSPLTFRFLCWLGGATGICDWCVKAEKLDRIVEPLQAHNIVMSAIEKFTRIKPNLEIAKWFLAAPIEQRLPFFIEDISPTAIRIPSGEAAIHDNKCAGISRLLLSEQIYACVTEQIRALESQARLLANQTQIKEVQLVSELRGHIGIEMAGFESKVKVLQMPHNEPPIVL